VLGGKPAPQQVQLMAQEDNLGLQPRLRLKRRSQYMQQQAKERTHPPTLADGRHDKHIDGGDVRGVIAEKGLPAL
jgi:hypothetical protein